MLRSMIAIPLLLTLLTGCGSNDPSTERPGDSKEGLADKTDPAALTAGKQHVLAAERTPSKGVTAIRKEAKAGDEVVVVGRVGGSSKPLTEGEAVFLLVDLSLEPGNCECPWDYCETSRKELAAGRLSVKFVGADGKTVANGARGMFGIKELSTVVIRGKVQRDDKDNVIVLANGIFVRHDQP